MLGVVKWFDTEKGFGFIAPDGSGTDVFVHIRSLPASVVSLTMGDRLSFDVQDDPRHPGRMRATNVSLIAAAPLTSTGGWRG